MKNDGLEKEYMTGRRDQFDVDLSTFWDCVRASKSRDDLIENYKKEMSLIITNLASQRAKELRGIVETPSD